MTNDVFLKLIEDKFGIHEDKNDIELETWTSGGVNMFIHIEKNSEESYLDQYRKYVSEFSVDKEVDLHREDKLYRSHFTVRKSLEDFEAYKQTLQEVLSEVENTKQ
jgi:hypothetical protein